MGSTTINHLAQKYPQVSFVNIDRNYYCASVKNVHKKDSRITVFIKVTLPILN